MVNLTIFDQKAMRGFEPRIGQNIIMIVSGWTRSDWASCHLESLADVIGSTIIMSCKLQAWTVLHCSPLSCLASCKLWTVLSLVLCCSLNPWTVLHCSHLDSTAVLCHYCSTSSPEQQCCSLTGESRSLETANHYILIKYGEFHHIWSKSNARVRAPDRSNIIMIVSG